ncbi:hypothetical protein AB0M95_38780 [Sphaerisporangium sp. NPDC051017]|uniref:hypothetical protein n=1 Tax=Sphaerisporangium sp. NPDC051017 TaxID=3154636 RepID=UPI00344949BF
MASGRRGAHLTGYDLSGTPVLPIYTDVREPAQALLADPRAVMLRRRPAAKEYIVQTDAVPDGAWPGGDDVRWTSIATRDQLLDHTVDHAAWPDVGPAPSAPPSAQPFPDAVTAIRGEVSTIGHSAGEAAEALDLDESDTDAPADRYLENLPIALGSIHTTAQRTLTQLARFFDPRTRTTRRL